MECFYFELSAKKGLKEISTPISIACANGCCDIDSRPVYRCNAIWDTGATSSMISKKIAEKLKLHSTGKIKISGVHGVVESNTYVVDFIFCNGFEITGVHVSEADNGGGFDVLIGMDIIAKGKLIVDGINNDCYVSFIFPAEDI